MDSTDVALTIGSIGLPIGSGVVQYVLAQYLLEETLVQMSLERQCHAMMGSSGPSNRLCCLMSV